MLNSKNQSLHKLSHTLQSLLLIISMMGILGLVGWIVAGLDGLLLASVACAAILVLGTGISPRLMLRMCRARPIALQQAPELYEIVKILSHRAGLPMVPQLFYVPSPALNAFATGRQDEAVIAVTGGLLRHLNQRELIAVLAHELSHLRNNDMLTMALANTVSRMTLLLSQLGQLMLIFALPLMLLGEVYISLFGILVLIFAPAGVALLQLALSRTREFDADLGAVTLTGDPQGLSQALKKLEHARGNWLQRLLFPSGKTEAPQWLRTHPATAERIQRLNSLMFEQKLVTLWQPDRVRIPRDAVDGYSLIKQNPFWQGKIMSFSL
jgi:heat shock protein HtpX